MKVIIENYAYLWQKIILNITMIDWKESPRCFHPLLRCYFHLLLLKNDLLNALTVFTLKQKPKKSVKRLYFARV